MFNARLSHAVLLAAALAGATPAFAIDNLTIMAPAAPGGGYDSTARTMQEVLQATGLAKGVQVENVPGAGGTIGLAQFTKKRGDGKAMIVSGLVMVGAILSNKSPVTLEDATPIARLTSEWEALVVPSSSDIRTVADLAAKFKANPKSVSWGGGSAGGTDHILVGLFAKAVGGDPTQINYIAHSGGGQALAAILGGHVTVGVSGVSEFEAQVKAGQLRMIAISSPRRIPEINAPTLVDSGINVSLGNWRAVFGAPKLSNKDQTAMLEMVDKMVKSDAWKKQLKDKGWSEYYLAGDQFQAFLKNENTQVSGVLQSIGLLR